MFLKQRNNKKHIFSQHGSLSLFIYFFKLKPVLWVHPLQAEAWQQGKSGCDLAFLRGDLVAPGKVSVIFTHESNPGWQVIVS